MGCLWKIKTHSLITERKTKSIQKWEGIFPPLFLHMGDVLSPHPFLRMDAPSALSALFMRLQLHCYPCSRILQPCSLARQRKSFSSVTWRDVTFVFLSFFPQMHITLSLQGNVHIHTKLEMNMPGSAPRPGMHTQPCANTPTHSKIN